MQIKSPSWAEKMLLRVSVGMCIFSPPLLIFTTNVNCSSPNPRNNLFCSQKQALRSLLCSFTTACEAEQVQAQGSTQALGKYRKSQYSMPCVGSRLAEVIHMKRVITKEFD